MRARIERCEIRNRQGYAYLVSPLESIPEVASIAFLDAVSSWAKARMRDQRVSAIVCFEGMGVQFGTLVAYAMGVPLYIARKKDIKHKRTVRFSCSSRSGERKFAIYSLPQRVRIAIVDDVCGSGATFEAAVGALRRHKVNIRCALTVVSRGSAARDCANRVGIPIYAMCEVAVNSGGASKGRVRVVKYDMVT